MKHLNHLKLHNLFKIGDIIYIIDPIIQEKTITLQKSISKTIGIAGQNFEIKLIFA